MRRVSVALAVMVLGTGMLRAQSLGAAAQKEKERRAAREASSSSTSPPRVITATDLESGRPGEATVSAAEDGEAKKPADSSAPSQAPQPPWVIDGMECTGDGLCHEVGVRRRAAPDLPSVPGAPTTGVAERPEVRAAQEEWWKGRARLAQQTIELRKKELEAAERATAGGYRGRSRRVAQAQLLLDEAKRSLQVLEEEAQRAGVPPGWVR